MQILSNFIKQINGFQYKNSLMANFDSYISNNLGLKVLSGKISTHLLLQCSNLKEERSQINIKLSKLDNNRFPVEITLMITRVSKAFLYNKSFFFINNAKPPLVKPKPMAPKSPIVQLKSGQLHLSTVAQQLNLNEEVLRKQLINPKTSIINKQELKILSIINGKDLSKNINQDQLKMTKKSPVVTIMGHVDHGKTTLIDYLRKSNIAEGEIGGITQKIGAFHIKCHNQKITFIDTPGHQAFSNMRKRGAFVTDLIILIVSSTEGVKKQTQEVIEIINRDKIPTIVAITKIDLENADIQSVQESIFEAGLNIELKGGNIPVVHISAKTGQNVDLLSELILDQTKNLKGIEDEQAEGIVLEAYQSQAGMNAMTLIVKQGVLKQGSILVIGEEFTKVKNMYDDTGNQMKVAKPGDAVHIMGIPNIPAAGDFIYEVQDENKAKFITGKKKQINDEQIKKNSDKNTLKSAKLKLDWRTRKKMYGSASESAWISKFEQKEQLILAKIEQIRQLALKDHKFEALLAQKELELKNHKEYVYQFLVNIGENVSNFNVILKFSDRGIEETIHQQLESVINRIKTKHNITVNILKSDVGQIAASQVSEAATCKAEIFSFGSEPNHQAIDLISQLKISPKVHKLIHTFLKDFQESAINRKKNSIKGIQKGRGVIAAVFPIKSKKGTNDVVYVPGVTVNSGKISKTSKIYIFKNGSPASSGMYAKSIKFFKKEVEEVKKGQECTITFDFDKVIQMEKGDEIVAFEQ